MFPPATPRAVSPGPHSTLPEANTLPTVISSGYPHCPCRRAACRAAAFAAHQPHCLNGGPPDRTADGKLAISLGAMADSKDFDREWSETEEEDAVVAGAEAEFGAGRLEFDDVAGAGGEAGDR